MSDPVYRMGTRLSSLVQDLPIGTNLDLYLLMWMIVSGRLLAARGGIIPVLAALGLSAAAVLRAWRALGHGAWRIEGLVQRWQEIVHAEGQWQVHEVGGYCPLAVDLVGFYRPRLKDLPTKHYLPAARRALPAIVMGLAVRVGSVALQRVPLPAAILRMNKDEVRERVFQQRLLRQTAALMGPQDALVADRGFKQRELVEAGVTRYVLRLPSNFTARRNSLPAYAGHGRHPQYGAVVRPLARRYRGRLTDATPNDREESWAQDGYQLTAKFWDNLVDRQTKPGAGPTFTAIEIQDPRFAHPLLLGTSLPLTGQQLRQFYPDRWPVEVVPLTAKQMLGAARQFVWAPETRHRLPELVLLLGALMCYAAATASAIPTGFWDRAPQPTSGRLRRALATVDFATLPMPGGRIRKKNAVTAHLPKGAAAPRRPKAKPAEAEPPAKAA